MTEHASRAPTQGKALTPEEAIARCERSAKIHDIKALAANDEQQSKEEERKAAAARRVKKIIQGKSAGRFETAALPRLETITIPGFEIDRDELRGGLQNAENHNIRP